jgi:hypothetical protein
MLTEVKEHMNSKTKIFTVVLLSVAACMVVYLPTAMATQSSYELGDDMVLAEMEQNGDGCDHPLAKARLLWWLLNHSEPVEVEGTIVKLSDTKLVLSSGKDQIRVQLPEEWIVDGEEVTFEELFTSGYLSEGESITVKTLRINLIEKVGLNIYVSIGYEITDDTCTQAYANMDVNIEA